MKAIFQKIMSLLLIPVVLFSTTTFGMSKHICMESVYSISYAGEAEDCGMEMGTPKDDVTNGCSISTEDCCSTERAKIIGSSSDQIDTLKFNAADYDLLSFYIISKYDLFQGSIKALNFYKDYSPPKVTKNISVLYQVFII